jgi:hypothetical protein
MSRQDPFEIILQKFFRALDLLRPGVPADSLGGGYCVFVHEEMITSEEEFIFIEDDHMAFGVTRDFDDLKLRRELPVAMTPENMFATLGRRREFIFMDHSLALEVIIIKLVVGHIVPVRENHHCHPSPLLQFFDKLGMEARGINQDISLWTLDKVSRGPKRRFRGITAVENIFINGKRKIEGRTSKARIMLSDTDRISGTGNNGAFDFRPLIQIMRLRDNHG